MIRPNCRGMDDCRYTRPKSVQYEARADRMNTLSALKFANSPVRSFTTACTSLPSTLCCAVDNTRVKQTFNAVRPLNPSKCFVCVCMCSTRQQIRCSRIRKFLTRRQSVRVCVCVCVCPLTDYWQQQEADNMSSFPERIKRDEMCERSERKGQLHKGVAVSTNL